MTLSEDDFKQAVNVLLHGLPYPIRSAIGRDSRFCEAVGFRPSWVTRIGGFPPINRHALYVATQDACSSGSTVTITLSNGDKVDVSMGERAILLDLHDQKGEEAHAELVPLLFIHPDPDVRLSALREMIQQAGVTHPDRTHWETELAKGPLSDEGLSVYHEQLRGSFGHCISSVARAINTNWRNPSGLVPRDIRYFECLCGPAPKELPVQEYLETNLAPHMRRLIMEDLTEALQILLPLGIQSETRLLPYLAEVDDDDLWQAVENALPVYGPASALNLFEICLERAAHDKKWLKLAKDTLSGLLDNGKPFWDGLDGFRFFEVLYGLVADEIRVNPAMRSQPPYWRHLCVWAHTGQLMRLLGGNDLDIDDWDKWVGSEHDGPRHLSMFLDLYEAPLSRDQLTRPILLESVMVRELTQILSTYNDQNSEAVAATERVRKKLREIQQEGESLSPLFQGPLYLDRDDLARGDLAKTLEAGTFFAAIRENLEKGVAYDDNFLSTILNLAQVVPLQPDILNLLESQLPPIRPGKELNPNMPEANGMFIAANIACISGHLELAEGLIRRVINAAPEMQSPEEVINGAMAILICCAAYSDAEQQYGKLGEYYREMAFVLPLGDCVGGLGGFIHTLKRLIPVRYWRMEQAEALCHSAAPIA